VALQGIKHLVNLDKAFKQVNEEPLGTIKGRLVKEDLDIEDDNLTLSNQ